MLKLSKLKYIELGHFLYLVRTLFILQFILFHHKILDRTKVIIFEKKKNNFKDGK